VLCAMAQVMGTLSRFAQDLMVFTMPEFGYFTISGGLLTGSSIMPQKNNPDILELMRARSALVNSYAAACMEITRGLPSGYNRDLQETKELFMKGLSVTRASIRIARRIVEGLTPDKETLVRGFTPAIFAADKALSLAASGMPFRDAYDYVKDNIETLQKTDPTETINAKVHEGAAGGLDFALLQKRLSDLVGFANTEQVAYYTAISSLIGHPYPITL
ncbi:MAG: argininosuccinate lyase, partial [Lentisphaerae bacterium]|nr:argininosuccinate lyase [Lentisphaerota bacterium]